MKTRTIKSISKRIVTGFLAVAMVVTGMVVMPKEVKASDTTKIFYDDGTTESKQYAIQDYWTDDVKTAPVKPGFVFGGWYVKNDEKDVPLKEADLVNGGINNYTNTAYAKFVPAEVLSIKTQAALGEIGGLSSLRILSTVDSLNYQEVGFEYKLGNKDEAQTGKGNIAKITKVYSAIKPYRDATDEDLLKPGEKFVKDVSQYFIAADVSKIRNEDRIIYARPFWVTMDGTEVMGLARNDRIEDKRNGYTSVGINLLPQLSEGKLAMVAAGKIQISYNHEAFDVVETPDIAEPDTKGGKYLFSEMDCHVDKEAGTITFAGNAPTVNTNLLADGLFANVRFVRKVKNSDATLNFKIETGATNFCNWVEQPVNELVVQ